MPDMMPTPTHDPHELHPNTKLIVLVAVVLTAMFTLAATLGGIALFTQMQQAAVSSTPNTTTQPTPITATGTIICLPHKDATGPQTMECALGLKGDDGKNYGLSDSNVTEVGSIGTDTQVTVIGTLMPPTSSVYDIAGTITVQSIKTTAIVPTTTPSMNSGY